MHNQTYLIGIAGGTGSGKTSISKEISADFDPSKVAIIQQDSYYRDLSMFTMEERSEMNFDHPDAIDFDLMKHSVFEERGSASRNAYKHNAFLMNFGVFWQRVLENHQ